MKIKKLVSLIILPIILGVASLAPIQHVFADNICDNANISEEIRAASGCTNNISADKIPQSLPTVVARIIRAVVAVLGVVAVVFIVIGGVSYMTSTGDPGKVKKAKDTILYAVIGLIICSLAFAITQFAINAINSSTNCPTGEVYDNTTQTCQPSP